MEQRTRAMEQDRGRRHLITTAPIVVAVFLSTAIQAHAGGPTPTPTVAQPPAAPTNLRIEGNNLVWDDNSNNEDGFRIRRSVGGGSPEVLATVAADTTSAPTPPGPTPSDPCATRAYSVVAFNGAGESAPSNSVGILVTDCGTPLAATATTGPGFPPSGQGGPTEEGSPLGVVLPLVALAVILALLAGAVSLRRFGP